jgi:hypothetical protein
MMSVHANLEMFCYTQHALQDLMLLSYLHQQKKKQKKTKNN